MPLPQVDWLALYKAYYRPFAFWNFAAGLIAKPLVGYSIARSLSKGVFAGMVMNGASSALNVITIPAVALLLAAPFVALQALFMHDLDRSDPLCWITLVLTIALVNTGLEAAILRFAFRERFGRKAFGVMWIANATCIAGGIYGMIVYYYHHPPIA